MSTPEPDEQQVVLCPFCNHTLDIELYNGMYGCESGCEYMRFEVQCPACQREIYSTGEFGSFGPAAWDDDEEEVRESFMRAFAAEVEKINARRAAQEVQR